MRNKLFSVVGFLLLLQLPVLGQSDLKKADKYFSDLDYALAIEEYKKVLNQGEPSLYITQKIADCYNQINNTKEAEFWYAQVLNFPNHNMNSVLDYARVAKQNANYEKAKKLFQQYADKVPAEAAGMQREIAGCDKGRFWMANPLKVDVRKEMILSSDASDFSPYIFQDQILFATDKPSPESKDDAYGWTGSGYVKLYKATKQGDSWGDPAPLPEAINTAYHNGPATYTADGQTLIFTRSNQVKKRLKDVNSDPTSWVKKNKRNVFINRLELFISKNSEAGWSVAEPFAYNKPSEYSVGHPAISPKGDILYFVSDMPGGSGMTDIYYSEKQADGNWGTPVNAGSEINTAGREMFPSFDQNGVLYFASDGHVGMGGLDIFKAEGEKSNWQKVENLAYPFNSSRDDFGIVFDRLMDTGYLSSNRLTDNGTDDILSFRVIRIPCVVVGRTFERIVNKQRSRYKEEAVPEVKLKLYREGDTTALVMHSDKDGRFFYNIHQGINYQIKGSKDGYLTKTISFVPECKSNTDSINIEMIFNRKVLNAPVVIDNIYYDLDKYAIREDAKPELNKVVQMLTDNPDVKIELSSHTDSRQTNSYNQMLSQLRAESAVVYIVSRGISPERIIAKGYGETQLLNRCKDGVRCSEDEHQLNRRTEFKLIK